MMVTSNGKKQILKKCADWNKRILPKDVNYHELVGLRKEAQEKLQQVKPANIGQASRISGVSPADISVLLIWLSKL